ncbi:MAG: hypothetical protein A2720_00075 [Candidatus Doudnabacteria bacterium RIFCSPHIGHO2_01_FULL_46_24]|uniref:Uncharacterized protein n=1 Tax=Candidatus Doudnabacteria bacterium RIFCSPHIGHO2_01_FULL_46_24 TaxID=1817825 RepID=A0A1F5NVS2_9BACT|nr:MAG: hypothetical protein A2720_00075 [Candidatus Doudnabacteria bacterium RIFCSPHIGHO2_01_FULL_46_24]
MAQLLLLLPEWLRNLFLGVGNWTREHIHETVHVLFRALILNVGLLGLGLLLARVGFAGDWLWLIGTGRFLTALAGMLAAILWLYMYVRLWVLAQAGIVGDTALIESVKQVSRPLPDKPIELPEIFTQARADKALRAVMSGLAAVAAGSAYASLVPVFTNLSLFFALVTLAFATAFAIWPSPEQNPRPVARKWLMVPLAIMVICTVSFFRPFDGRRNLRVNYAEGEARLSTAEYEAAGIERLSEERNAILARLPNLTAADQTRLSEINQLIADIQAGRYTNRPSSWDLVSVKEAWQSAKTPELSEELVVFLIITLLLGALLLHLATRKSGASTH